MPRVWTEEQKERRRQTQREWVKNNPDKIAEYNKRHGARAAERAKAWQAANPERVNAKNREWRAKNHAAVREREIAYNADNIEARRAAGRKSMRRRMGVINPTDETKTGPCYNGGCDYVGPLVFDHHHDGPKAGHFRGWLCDDCNIGRFRENARKLRGMADYLDLANGVGWPT